MIENENKQVDNKQIENEDIIYKAKEQEQKAVSFVWILPLIILCILAWISYESYMKKGTNITVVFNSAEGLKEGATTLEYKGLQLGKVTKIDINDDLKNVKVNILVKSSAAKYVASEGSRFWIRRPTISLTKVSGLSTLVDGFKIEISPKFKTEKEFENAKEKYDFIGLDSKPDDELLSNGYYISLIANDKDSVEVGTPIFYNKYQIGEIVSKEFKFEKVFLNAYIYDKFNYLVNKSSKFILNEALNVSYGPSGLNIEVGSLYSALVGGVTVITSKKDEEKIQKDEVYTLYAKKDSFEEKEYIHIKFSNVEGVDENTPIIYKGVVIGKLTNISLNPNDVTTKAFIYKKYKHLLTTNTEFFIQTAEVSIDGVKNLGNIIKGNFISLNYKEGEASKIFIARNFKENSINESKTFNKSLIYTLKSDNLNSITKKSKIYFKNIEIGEVLDYSLAKDFKKVNIKILINKKYQKLIHNHTLFYDMSSKLLELKDFKVDVNYSGITPLLNGAIGIAEIRRDKKQSKKSFKLYSSYSKIEKIKRLHNDGFTVDAYFNNDFKIKKDMAIVYKNQEIGFVKTIKFNSKESNAKLFIYKEYKKYLNKTSRFYKKGVLDVQASLNGIIFNMDNFTSLIEGSIVLENNTNMLYDKYNIYASKDDMKDSSNSITIVFDDVEGVYEQFSKLTYKGVNIGKVTNVSFNSKNKVIVKAQIYSDYNSFTKEGTIFYLKKPVISLQEVSNIGSSLMAVNIGVIKSKKTKYQTKFTGFDALPSIDKSYHGTIFKVHSHHASSAREDSPIYYKNVQIGKINKIDLSSDATTVIMDCLIYDKYTKFIRSNSVFYDISGFNMKFSIFSGSKVESNTFTSILKGGLVVVTPYEYEEKASSNDKFILIEELREDWESISPSIK
ncbi:MlaD family protein [Poseidonibacter ostreae]|jgi:paraquat-inducible protein B|uniref:MCE family protein n=1 Tax=Poseidonibacter ostreae TaxID=2654171 RepID=A0A6L4WPD0_9BACT|nr:MlaD family protein [Poseidonibacter ostreae]KAB7885879.1 MCE family protein [Poseidonibacter ostreae]KAB7888329.1 MCE family protein [Poseidonibacter ostreae]KAB7888444.1 MCE family protein [Poseidonibacter ostreae]